MAMVTRRLIIIGSGPAGYAAAVYAARAELAPLQFAGENGGGQLMLTTKIENYPGFPEGILGPTLMQTMRQQAENFGAEIVNKNVVKVDFSKKPFEIMIQDHTIPDRVGADAVIIATGAEAMPLCVPGEKEYTGRGVSYCAVCDAPFYRNKQVFVAGGGDAAMEDTLALTKFSKKITLVHRRDKFRASKIMQERVLTQKGKVAVWWNSEVVEVLGNGRQITGLKIKNILTQQVKEVPTEGLFVAIGHKPATAFLKDQVDLDIKGYIKTGINYPEKETWLNGFPTMTNIPGVFAAGDNVDFRYRQAVTAASMGVQAALDAEKWLERK